MLALPMMSALMAGDAVHTMENHYTKVRKEAAIILIQTAIRRMFQRANATVNF